MTSQNDPNRREAQRLLHLFDNLLQNYDTRFHLLLKRVPTLVETDIRRTTVARLGVALRSLMFSLLYVRDSLLDLEWWQEHTNPVNNESERLELIHGYMEIQHHGFVVSFYSLLESGYRVMLRHIDTKACKESTSHFRCVYHTLFEKLLSEPLPQATTLMDIWAAIRNSIHNGGLYYPSAGRLDNVVYSYKGREFRLIRGEHIDFASWDNLADLSSDILDVFCQVVEDKNITRHDFIKDTTLVPKPNPPAEPD